MKNVVVDFESYYDKEISVTTQGLRNYVRDSDAYMVSIVSDDLEFCGSLDDARREGFDKLAGDPNIQLVAFNANFDQAWWDKYFPRSVNDWKCGLDHAAFHQYPRNLAGVAKTTLNEKLDKTIRDEMKGVRFESLPDERQQQVLDYCLNDSIVEKRILDAMAPMTPLEDRLAAHTRLLNRRGIRINLEKLERDCGHLEMLHHTAVHNLPWVEGGGAPLSYPEFAGWCRTQGVEPPTSLDKRDAECVDWIAANPGISHALKNMRVVRGSNTKLKKLKLMEANADAESIIPLDLLYCGARHTRRWSSVNINVQNLDAKRVFEDEMAQLDYFKENPTEQPGLFMREYFLPPPKKKFGILDFKAIEPVCSNWLVRNEELLEALRMGFGIYEAHARATMGWKGNPNTLKKENPELYKFAKIRVLALGYGMGTDKFQATAALAGIILTAQEAKKQVDDFRATNRKIVGKWREFDRLIREAAMNRDDHTLQMTMPTGDLLTHFAVRSKLSGGYESYTIKGEFSQMSHQPRLWGGTLFENVVQRMARDILAEAVLRIEDAGIPVCFHAHDEVVLALDEATAEKDFEEAKRTMSIPPDWCTDLPLAAEGGIFDHYLKMD